jgi:hypothetical protein
VLLVLGGLLTTPVLAQRDPGSTTLGVQVGQPGGVTVKVYRSSPIVYDAVVTGDGDDFLRLYLHRLWERPLPEPPMHVYYGPGLLVGGQRTSTTLRPELGLSSIIGLNFYAERFEVFLHASPVLQLHPALDPTLGGSVGLRYDLHQP